MQQASEALPISIIAGQQWTPLVVGGVTYRQAPLTLAQMGELEAWVRAQFPDPLATARRAIAGLPVELAREIMMQAIQQANNPRWCFGTDACTAVVRSLPGMVEMLSLELKKYHPELTREDVTRIVEQLHEAEQLEDATDQALEVATAHEPIESILEGLSDPKAPGATES